MKSKHRTTNLVRLLNESAHTTYHTQVNYTMRDLSASRSARPQAYVFSAPRLYDQYLGKTM